MGDAASHDARSHAAGVPRPWSSTSVRRSASSSRGRQRGRPRLPLITCVTSFRLRPVTVTARAEGARVAHQMVLGTETAVDRGRPAMAHPWAGARASRRRRGSPGQFAGARNSTRSSSCHASHPSASILSRRRYSQVTRPSRPGPWAAGSQSILVLRANDPANAPRSSIGRPSGWPSCHRMPR